MLTLHELPPLLRAGAGDGQGELVHGDAPRDGQVVDALVRRLPRQQLPQHHAVAERNTDSFKAYSSHTVQKLATNTEFNTIQHINVQV